MPLNDSPVPQPLYPKLPIDQENFEIDKSKEKIYLGVELLDSKSASEKRKLVCIVSHKEKLVVKKYDHEEFEKNANFQDNKVFINTDLVKLVLYAKRNEQKQCSDEIEKILKKSFDVNNENKIYKIRGHFNNVWGNIREFSTYADMLSAYDIKTGNYIHHSLHHLVKIYLDTEKEYQQLNASKDVFSKESSDILKEMESILTKMKVIYEENKKDFQHLSTNTISPVEKSFEKLVSDFKEKTQQLEIAKSNAENLKKLEIIEENLINLQNDCKNAIPSEEAYPQAIFKEKDEIISEIETLLQYSKSLKNLITSKDEINGLQNKLNELKDKLANLNARILPGTVNQNTQEVISLKEVESLFEKLQEVLVELKALETKGEDKKKIKEELIRKIDNILKLGKQCSPEELNNAINDANQFIENNKDKASVYTGGLFGKVLGEGHSKLGAIVEKLQRLFAEFLSKLFFNQTNASIEVTPKTCGRG